MKRLLIFIFPLSLIVSISSGQNIYTPNNTLVNPDSYFTYNLSQSELDAAEDLVESGIFGSSTVIVVSASNNYNCHSYAWNMYPTQGAVIGLDDLDDYLVPGVVMPTYINDNSFISTTNTTLPGVLVKYSGDHSAVVVNVTNRFISKWGPGPRVRHAPGDVPSIYGSPQTYYQCNFSPLVSHAILNNSTTASGPHPGFSAPIGAHRIDMYGYPNTHYSFVVPPTPPSGLSIYSQFSNTVLFDKTAYGMQGRYIFVTMSNECAVPSVTSTISVYDPPGAAMAVYPVPSNGEFNIVFEDMDEELVLEDMTLGGIGPSLPVSVEVFDGSNNKVADLTSQVTQKANKVNITHLGKGTYYLKAFFRGGFIETKRVVID